MRRVVAWRWPALLPVFAVLLAACEGVTSPAASAPASASASPASKPAESPAASGLETVKVAIPAKGVAYLNLFAGKDLGVFQKHGIDLQLSQISPGAALPAVQQGQIDFLTSIASAARLAEKGQPIRVVYIAADHDDFVLVGAKGITQASQLKGKVVAGATPGSELSELAIRLLDADGLPASDYKMLYVGGGSAAVAALSNGEVSAAMLDVADAVLMQDQGYPFIDSAVRFLLPAHGLATSLHQIEQRGPVLRRALAACLESTRLVATDKAQVVPVMTKEFDLSAADANQIFDQLKPTWVLSGRPGQDVIDEELTADQAILKLPAKPKESDVYDFSLLPPAPASAAGGSPH
jgi:NitT/TauT family transport system substrate-binding protein